MDELRNVHPGEMFQRGDIILRFNQSTWTAGLRLTKKRARVEAGPGAAAALLVTSSRGVAMRVGRDISEYILNTEAIFFLVE